MKNFTVYMVDKKTKERFIYDYALTERQAEKACEEWSWNYCDENGKSWWLEYDNEWTEELIWKLRNEIVLNSCYVADYENSFKISANIVCAFFDGYISYLETELDESGKEYTWEDVLKMDTSENLWNWFNCFDCCPFE